MASEAGVAQISAGELHNKFLEGEEPGLHFILVDLRASDFKGGTIKGSLNIPMESLPSAIPTLRQVAYYTEISFLANHISDLPQRTLQLEVDSVLLLLILNEVRMVKTEEEQH